MEALDSMEAAQRIRQLERELQEVHSSVAQAVADATRCESTQVGRAKTTLEPF